MRKLYSSAEQRQQAYAYASGIDIQEGRAIRAGQLESVENEARGQAAAARLEAQRIPVGKRDHVKCEACESCSPGRRGNIDRRRRRQHDEKQHEADQESSNADRPLPGVTCVRGYVVWRARPQNV